MSSCKFALRTAAITIVAAITLSCGGGGDDGTAPAGGRSGVWAGTTSQGHPVRFLVESDKVRLIEVRWAITGTSCNKDLDYFFFQLDPLIPFPVQSNAFTATRTGSDVSFTLNATFAENGSASGTIAVSSSVCHGESSITWTATKATGPTVNLAGAWNGTVTSDDFGQANFNITFAQSGSSISGPFTAGAFASGNLNGKLTDRLMTFTLTSTTPGCPGTYDALGVVMALPASGSVPARDFMTFAFFGTDCAGELRGNGSASRSQ